MSIGESRVSYAGFNTRQLTLEGAGPCIVLLHGFGHPVDCWRPVLAHLAETGNAAIAVDLPGFGEADPLGPGPLMPQLDDFVDAVVMSVGDREPVVLVGNSLGGAVALRAIARDRGLPIGALVSIDAAGFGWTPAVYLATRRDSALIRYIGGAPVPAALRDNVARLFLYGDWRRADPKMIKLATNHMRGYDTRSRFLKLATRFVTEVMSAGIGPVDCSTTVVHGLRDRIIPLWASERIHKAIPGSRLIRLDGAGHCPHLDVPDVIASIVNEHAVDLRQSKPA